MCGEGPLAISVVVAPNMAMTSVATKTAASVLAVVMAAASPMAVTLTKTEPMALAIVVGDTLAVKVRAMLAATPRKRAVWSGRRSVARRVTESVMASLRVARHLDLLGRGEVAEDLLAATGGPGFQLQQLLAYINLGIARQLADLLDLLLELHQGLLEIQQGSAGHGVRN